MTVFVLLDQSDIQGSIARFHLPSLPPGSQNGFLAPQADPFPGHVGVALHQLH